LGIARGDLFDGNDDFHTEWSFATSEQPWGIIARIA